MSEVRQPNAKRTLIGAGTFTALALFGPGFLNAVLMPHPSAELLARRAALVQNMKGSELKLLGLLEDHGVATTDEMQEARVSGADVDQILAIEPEVTKLDRKIYDAQHPWWEEAIRSIGVFGLVGTVVVEMGPGVVEWIQRGD